MPKMEHVDFLGAAEVLPVPLRRVVTGMLRRRLGAQLTLDPQEFAGRRVLILGPARTVDEDLAALRPERFDLIVRMNNGLDTPIAALGPDPLRCDLLFHSLTTEARPVTPDKLTRAGIDILVHRTPVRGAFLQTVLASRRLAGIARVRCLPMARHQSLANQLDGFSPTTGLLAVSFFLDAPVAEVAVAGFTFFQTAYCRGYDPAVTDDAAAQRRIAAAAHHDPVAEARLLGRLLTQARDRGLTVTLGPAVQAALEGAGQLR
ncbi:hypothetical protein [Paracoccus rhizosphaerae]|uniref:Uncharacterized protein n=2 Tax=Paracoccus rhizosphaerae TaxID=1133347 RepID=A0ABV6CIZ2_9RHOB|nr:hypothetical protein [Paracoccus rhizosphaerae]